MAKLIQLKEAAEFLGISEEDLREMVDQKEIFPIRDGAILKFKPTDLERLAADRGLGGGGGGNDEGPLGLADDDMIDVDELKLDDDSSEDADSILVSEEELGRSDDSTSSTIIGKTGPESPEDSDIKLADALESEGDLGISASDSDLSLAAEGGSNLSLSDSDLDLSTEKAGASDVLAGDSDLLSIDEGGAGPMNGSGIDLSLDDGSGTGGSSLKLSGSDAISLDDELSLESDSGSGAGADSVIDLDLDDDDLAGSGMGSDITLGASDSGINLTNPSDSGISLEDVPSDLGSGIDSSLDLGDDDMIELEADPADPEEVTDLQTDDEFMLTPVPAEGEMDEESDDSGSQVIALDSDEFDESAATMLVADDDAGLEVEEDAFAELGGEAPAVSTAAAAAGATAVAAAEEADFSAWNIVGLAMLSGFMGICGLLALDVIRNIWSWQQPFSVSNSLMDFLVGLLS